MKTMSEPYLPRVIQIGSTGRNSGKTTLALELIRHLRQERPVYSLKIITIKPQQKGHCQRGGLGCGICTAFIGGYEWQEETVTKGSKDTCQMLAAGSTKTFLLKAVEEQLAAGFAEIYRQLPPEAWLICESNTLRKVVRPQLFVMMDNQKKAKPSAAAVFQQADVVLQKATDFDWRQLAWGNV